jgi:hypothetical protein
MRAVPLDRARFLADLDTEVQRGYNLRSTLGVSMSQAETLADLEACMSAILKIEQRLLDAEQQCEFRLRDMREVIARRKG